MRGALPAALVALCLSACAGGATSEASVAPATQAMARMGAYRGGRRIAHSPRGVVEAAAARSSSAAARSSGVISSSRTAASIWIATSTRPSRRA